MAQRLADHIWTIGELLEACLSNAPTKPRKVHRRFTVIQEASPISPKALRMLGSLAKALAGYDMKLN